MQQFKNVGDENRAGDLFSADRLRRATRGREEKNIDRISVVVCTIGRREALDRCLASLRRVEREGDLEIVVVDNRPSAPTRAIVEKHSAHYVAEPIVGLSRARNAGLAHARGETVAFIDDDSAVHDGWLAALREEFTGDVAAVAGPIASTALDDDAGAFLPDARRVVDRSDPQWFEICAFGGVGNGGNMAFRRTALMGIGGFDERLGLGSSIAGGEEHDVFLRLVDAGFRVATSPRPVVTHAPAPGRKGERAATQRRAGAAFMFWLLWHRKGFRSRVARYLWDSALQKRRAWRAFRPNGRPMSGWEKFDALIGGAFIAMRALVSSSRR